MGRILLTRINWPGLAFILLILVSWEIAAQLAASRTFPPVSSVAMTLVTDWSRLATATLATLRRAALGFSIALIVMLPLGILLGRVRVLGEIIEPVLEFLRPLPPVAVVPLAMMALGIGDEAKLVIVVFGASFPIVISTLDAVKVQDPMQTRLGRSLRLTTFEQMTQIDLPAALPRIFAGIRLSITVALLLTVVSEIILSTDGLGAYLKLQQSTYNMTRILTAIMVIALVSVAVNALTNGINRFLLDWHFRRSAGAER